MLSHVQPCRENINNKSLLLPVAIVFITGYFLLFRKLWCPIKCFCNTLLYNITVYNIIVNQYKINVFVDYLCFV